MPFFVYGTNIMKARIIGSADERIIAYKQQENLVKLKKTADKLHIKLIIAEDNEAETPIGFFAGFNGFEKSEKSGEADNGCIIFSGLSGKKIDTVLAELRKAEISVPLKAVLTPSNQKWSIKKLTAELAKEREKLGG